MPKRTDANQTEIVDTLRSVGATVQILSAVGDGCPDLLVGFRGENYLLEVKDGNKPPSKRRLTPAEKKFFDTWKGQVQKVMSENQALKAIGAI